MGKRSLGFHPLSWFLKFTSEHFTQFSCLFIICCFLHVFLKWGKMFYISPFELIFEILVSSFGNNKKLTSHRIVQDPLKQSEALWQLPNSYKNYIWKREKIYKSKAKNGDAKNSEAKKLRYYGSIRIIIKTTFEEKKSTEKKDRYWVVEFDPIDCL